jgi:hypothetical protein
MRVLVEVDDGCGSEVHDGAAGVGEAPGTGVTIPHLRKQLQISDQTFYQRLKYGAPKEDEAQRLDSPNGYTDSPHPPVYMPYPPAI